MFCCAFVVIFIFSHYYTQREGSRMEPSLCVEIIKSYKNPGLKSQLRRIETYTKTTTLFLSTSTNPLFTS